MATDKGVWNLQQVRDKQLQSLWTYSAPSGDPGELYTWGYNVQGALGLNDKVFYLCICLDTKFYLEFLIFKVVFFFLTSAS